MTPRSRHHLPSTPMGRRDVDLVVRQPFAVMVLVAFLGVAAAILGATALMATHSPWEDTTTSGVVPDGGVHGVPEYRVYPRTVTEVGRLVSIAATSVSMQDTGGAVVNFAITPDTIVVPPYGMDGRPIDEQFVPNQPVVVIAHVVDGVATATAVVDPGPARRPRSPVPLVLA